MALYLAGTERVERGLERRGLPPQASSRDRDLSHESSHLTVRQAVVLAVLASVVATALLDLVRWLVEG